MVGCTVHAGIPAGAESCGQSTGVRGQPEENSHADRSSDKGCMRESCVPFVIGLSNLTVQHNLCSMCFRVCRRRQLQCNRFLGFRRGHFSLWTTCRSCAAVAGCSFADGRSPTEHLSPLCGNARWSFSHQQRCTFQCVACQLAWSIAVCRRASPYESMCAYVHSCIHRKTLTAPSAAPHVLECDLVITGMLCTMDSVGGALWCYHFPRVKRTVSLG